jgi:hypothetical protein
MNNKFNKYPMKKIRTILIFTSLVFAISSNLYAEDAQCMWVGVERIVAVGDLHGDYEVFIHILKENKIIDEGRHWIAEKTHLVQIGDIFDRGPQARRILDFMMILEKEAEEAGGKVHVLIGNHEFMNIAGIAFDYRGYMSLDQFVSFLPDEYREKIEMEFWQKRGRNSPPENNSDHFFNPSLRPEWLKFLSKVLSRPNHEARQKYTQNLVEKYGEWLTHRNAVIKINDIIFVHGGISEKYSKKKLAELNEAIRKELKSLASAAKTRSGLNIRPKITFDSDGPLWDRELATTDEKGFEEEVDKILKNLKARCMVIAHTPQLVTDKNDMSRFNEKIWIVDTGNSRVYANGRESAIIIENGEFDVWLGKPRKKETSSLESTKQFQEGIGPAILLIFNFLSPASRQK